MCNNDHVQFFLHTVSQEIANFEETVDSCALQKAAQLIRNSEKEGGRVHLTGIGKPSYVAGYIASLLSSTGTPAYVLHGTECVHGSAGQTKPGDVVIAISNSGETAELKATVECLKALNVHIIAVCGNPNSYLAQAAEVTLLAHVDQEGDSLNKPPRASILVEILVLQCLTILLQEDFGLDKTQYVSWHPGGSLGASIRDEQQK